MRARSAVSLLVVLLFVTAFVPPALAQTSGTISGTIVDASGAVLPGVHVTTRNAGTGLVRSAITGAQGRFAIPALPPGTYEVRAELAGFKPQVRPDVLLAVAETLALNMTLQLGDLAIEDRVVGVTPLVNTTTSELSYLVGSQAIEQLPLNGRNYTDLALLQPGVNSFPHRDGGSVVAHGLAMSVNGQDPRSNVYLLDGTIQNDMTNGPAGSAAGTALGMDTIREFRVEANAYSAEYGRNVGGQVNVLTKSGTNQYSGSLFEYHRNEALDAPNYFDTNGKPDFHRNQFGATLGGPLTEDRLFFFAGYEALIERLGRTISTIVPDDNARLGILPDPADPGRTITVPINPIVAPFLAEFPRANGSVLGGGLAAYNFPFRQTLDEHFFQGRLDYNLSANHQLFARYTLDDADQFLPTDYPQFPRTFFSRNQFFTAESRQILSASTLNTTRIGFSRTRVGQNVEAHTTQALPEFVTGRGITGSIDVGGMRRFGPQSSANLRLVQNVFSLSNDLVHTRGGHVVKAGALAEHYQDNMVNPTFSNGIFAFPNLSLFLQGRPNNFIGLTPEAQFDRYWRFTLFGFYLQDDFQISPRLTVNGGLRYEFTTMPRDKYNRDSSLPDLSASGPTVGPLYREPHVHEPLTAGRLRVGCVRRRDHGRARRLRAVLQHEQPSEPDRHGHEPAGDPSACHHQPGVPRAGLQPCGGNLDPPRAVRSRESARARLQRQPPARAVVEDGADCRLRGIPRQAPAAQRRRQPGASNRHAQRRAVHCGRNAAAEHRVLDHRAEEQRRRLLVQRAHRGCAPALEPWLHGPGLLHALEERGHDPGVHLLFGCDERHDVGNAGVHSGLQQGAFGFRLAPRARRECHVGAAVREWADGRGRRAAGRLAGVGHLEHAQRQPADRVRAEQQIAFAVEPVARPWHRSGSPELRCRLRS